MISTLSRRVAALLLDPLFLFLALLGLLLVSGGR